MNTLDKELEILEHIYTREDVRQRDLAHIVGMSLGMTNAILKRLTQKGLLTVRKVNNRNIMYAVSPSGVDAIAKRSYRYLKRTIKNVVDYKEAILTVLEEVSSRGFDHVVLVGKSDLDFIVEHCCTKKELSFSHRKEFPDPAEEDGAFYLFSENHAGYGQTALPKRLQGDLFDAAHAGTTGTEANYAYLQDVLVAAGF